MLYNTYQIGQNNRPNQASIIPLGCVRIILPEYNFDEFREIVEKLAADRCRLSREIADKIASIIWYEIGTKDVRNALQLMKLVRSIDEVEKTARTITKYKPKILNPSLTTQND